MVKISSVRKDGTVEKLIVPNENRVGMEERILNFIYPRREEYKTAEALPVYPAQGTVAIDNIPKKPFIRGEKRLPNTSVINPEELNLKQAMKKEVFIRCPHCGQSHYAIVSNGLKGTLIMKYNNTFFPVKCATEKSLEEIINNFSFDIFMAKTLKQLKNRPDKLSDKYIASIKYMYYTEMNMLQPCDSDIDAENTTCLLCPVCGKQDDLWKWIDAYVNPLNYFETENICNICGGELVYVPEKDGNTEKHVCEKCGNIVYTDKKDENNIVQYKN